MSAIGRRTAKEGITGAALLALRQKDIRPIVDAFEVWLTAQEGRLSADPLGPVVRCHIRHFDARFVDGAEIDVEACLTRTFERRGPPGSTDSPPPSSAGPRQEGA